MNYIDADKLKAELEQQIKTFSIMHNTAASKEDYESMSRVDCVIARLRSVLAFVNSLQQWKPMNEVFPELKESVDERIRKSLIKSFTNQHSSNFPTVDGFTREQIIAYLEKQKDEAQKQFNLGVQAGREEAMYEMEKEQKPAEWSEDDYNAILIAIDWLQFYRDRFVATEEAKDEITTCVERLESLRPQPKIEWNNEDKKFIKELCDLLASIAKNNYVGRYYAPDLVSKLQSIHPQPHWKPSEEQMRAVFYASERNDKLGSVLWNLYNDLKKL